MASLTKAQEDEIRRLASDERRRQGLPDKVADPDVLDRVAAIERCARERSRSGGNG
jgi:hypothetical protein